MQTATPTVAILGAMDAEVKGIVARLEDRHEDVLNRRTVYTGALGDIRICCLKAGVGKAMAALNTATVIERTRPEILMFVGIAGALDTTLDIGDVVVATESVQHDLDATSFGFLRGEVPYEGVRYIASDPELVRIAQEYPISGHRFMSGRIVTGDQFCSAKTRSEQPWLTEELAGIAVEMEGAAAGLAAWCAGVRFLHIRIISDRADGSAPDDFARFLPVASNRIADLVAWIVPRV